MNYFYQKKISQGVTLIEMLVVISVLAIISTIVVSTFLNFKHNQSLNKDEEILVGLLHEARSQTLLSKNSSVYGVHITSSAVTLFTGGTYNESDSSNQVFPLNSSNTISIITLAGGGSDVVFDRLTGQTLQDGTIVLSSSRISQSKTVTIYKTGLIESQ